MFIHAIVDFFASLFEVFPEFFIFSVFYYFFSLSAAASMAKSVGDLLLEKEYLTVLEKGKKSYHEKLWNGRYYNYDSSKNYQHDSIMADMLAGQWYARSCGLDPIVPSMKKILRIRNILFYFTKNFIACWMWNEL